ncbi:unnamed protein product [Pleuronectes platessa]|uniref:Uncharacterized protein n=1 Tax=Pleuronectes platessa TaxID=8262 RepID=A0A9N7Z619_PLEPL|nr:unnamed protein product [Pleuronectes platessa]
MIYKWRKNSVEASDQRNWRLYQFDFMGLRNTTDIIKTTAVLSQLLGASRRVPPAVTVAEVIREKGPTRVQSGRRRPRTQSPPLLPRRRREVPPDEDLPVPHTEPPAARRGGRRSDCSPSRGTCPAVLPQI